MTRRRLTTEMKAKKDAGEPETALAAIKQRIDDLNKPSPTCRISAVAERQPQDLQFTLRHHLTQGDLARGFRACSTRSSGRHYRGQQRPAGTGPLAYEGRPSTDQSVMANRIGRAFGEGLVRSPDNFGKLGGARQSAPARLARPAVC